MTALKRRFQVIKIWCAFYNIDCGMYFDTFVDAASDKGSLLRVVVVGEEMIRGKGGYVAMKKSIHLLVIMPVYNKVQASAFFSTSMALLPCERLSLREVLAVYGCCSAGDGGVLDISTQIQPPAFEYQCVQVIQWHGNPRGSLDFPWMRAMHT
jgi:hypothetical protein